MPESPPPPYSEQQEDGVAQQLSGNEGHEIRNNRAKWLRLHTPSWWYPFLGIMYFSGHPYLYPLFTARLVPCFILSIVVYGTLFIWAYLPQVAFLALFHGFNASAWINGAFLVLGEGATIIALLFEALFVDETLADIFDAVLVESGHASLVSNGREVHDDPGLNARQRLGKPLHGVGRVYSPFSLRQIIEFILFLPLNFIPYAGVPLFLLATGLRAGPLHHWRYFKFLGLDRKQRKRFKKKMAASYTWFGAVHLALQLVPGFSMLFLMTTAAGSALWVVNLEKQRMRAVEERQQAALAETYVDNPI